MFSVHNLKVDCTALPHDTQNRHQYLVIENINIPERLVYEPVEFTAVLNRIKDYLTVEFSRPSLIPVHFQITAAYNLVHKVTGATRLWTGSFFPRGNSIASLTAFVIFNPEEFVNFVQRQTSRELIEDKLTWTNQDSSWQFDGLVSLIVNTQANVPITYSLLLEKGFIKNGPGKRVHLSFLLP
jgi:hypothetical protein